MESKTTTINCKGKLLNLQDPKIMGILNVTPDSFFDGGQFDRVESAVEQAGRMLKQGAAIIDIGGMSSRPGAEIIDVDTELSRVIPVIEKLAVQFPNTIISIDTVRSKVVRAAVEAGASIVNDISAGKFDADLYDTVAELGTPYILMHMKGTPKDMQDRPLEENVMVEVLDFLTNELKKLKEKGVEDVIVDPGFGFGKTVESNYKMLKNMSVFSIFGQPILAGISRKSMICKPLKISPKNALIGTTALHMIALQQGAKILRVHDVAEAKEVITLWRYLR